MSGSIEQTMQILAQTHLAIHLSAISEFDSSLSKREPRTNRVEERQTTFNRRWKSSEEQEERCSRDEEEEGSDVVYSV
jgi:hypothetical protein